MTQLLLQETRQARGLTQIDVATVLERSYSWLSRVEAGQIPLTIPDLVRLARLYQVHPLDLVIFHRFPPPLHWPSPLCEACQALRAAGLQTQEGATHDATPALGP